MSGYHWNGHQRAAERDRLDELWAADRYQHQPALALVVDAVKPPPTTPAPAPTRTVPTMTARRTTRSNRSTRLDTIRAGRTLEHLIADLRDQDDGTGPVLAQLLQRLLDGHPVDDALLDTARDYQDAARRAEQHQAARAADYARRAEAKTLRDAQIRAVVDAHACPRCTAPAGQPCFSLGPTRRTKPLLEPHAARLALDQ